MMRGLKSILEEPRVAALPRTAMPAATIALPLGVAALMTAFTFARKLGLGHFLKPHQYSIALGSAWTFVLCLAAATLDSAQALRVGGGLHFLVWVPAGALYLSSLTSRKEIDSSPTGAVVFTLLGLIGIAQLMGCDTGMSNLVMIIATLASFGAGLKFRGRPALLLLTWCGIGWSCWLGESGSADSAQVLTVLWELTAILVVKIATPLLDEHLVIAGGDAEAPSASAQGKWIW